MKIEEYSKEFNSLIKEAIFDLTTKESTKLFIQCIDNLQFMLDVINCKEPNIAKINNDKEISYEYTVELLNKYGIK